MGYSIAINEKFNSLEISFTDKPSEAIRNILKGFKFRWNPKKSIWYGFAEREEIEKALNGEKAEPKASKAKKAPEFDFNVKVGDLFYSSWGYEQTNTTFFPGHRPSWQEIRKSPRGLPEDYKRGCNRRNVCG